ncbi:hypothetical protein D3C72_1820010 [compost metagenome]
MPWLQSDVIGGQFICEPRHALRRVVEYRSGDAGLLDHAVAVENGWDFTQVDLGRAHGATAHDHAGIGGIVRNGIEHLAGRFGARVDLLDARIDDF